MVSTCCRSLSLFVGLSSTVCLSVRERVRVPSALRFACVGLVSAGESVTFNFGPQVFFFPLQHAFRPHMFRASRYTLTLARAHSIRTHAPGSAHQFKYALPGYSPRRARLAAEAYRIRCRSQSHRICDFLTRLALKALKQLLASPAGGRR